MPLPRFLNFSMLSQKNQVFPLNAKLGWLNNVLRQEKDVNTGALYFLHNWRIFDPKQFEGFLFVYA
jgi:hypothetical protein